MARKSSRRRRSSNRIATNVNTMMKPMMGMVAFGGAAIIGAGVLKGVSNILD